jgi:aerobic-type carbon monoxide dehydrogenase small subunit (CoxS/CutS family)
MSLISLKVNGEVHEVDVDPATPLLYVLRNDLGLRGPRFGCGLGQCGTCTVIIDGTAVRSCLLPASTVDGDITTLEGLSVNGNLHPLQQAWIEEQVPQCGYCQNGQIMTAKALLDRNPRPTDAEIRAGMEGALCRCMTYYRIQAAIKRVVNGSLASQAHSQPHSQPDNEPQGELQRQEQQAPLTASVRYQEVKA